MTDTTRSKGAGRLWAYARERHAESPLTCSNCGKPAVCIGIYEECGEDLEPLPACDDCCGHGNEDGRCEMLTPHPEA